VNRNLFCCKGGRGPQYAMKLIKDNDIIVDRGSVRRACRGGIQHQMLGMSNKGGTTATCYRVNCTMAISATLLPEPEREGGGCRAEIHMLAFYQITSKRSYYNDTYTTTHRIYVKSNLLIGQGSSINQKLRLLVA
jgi:hypothetical protein